MRGVAEQRNQRPQEQQPESGRPPRTVWSMLFAMLPLVLVVLVVAGIAGRCSFSPLGPSVDPGSAPTVNPAVELDRAARRVNFQVVRPQLPEGWRANSAGVRVLEGGSKAVQVGWLTGSGRYLRLVQSTATETDLVASETDRSPRARGVTNAGDRSWVVYDSIRSEVAWVGERSGVRLLITGSGTPTEFRRLAEATLNAPVVAPGS